MSRKFKTSQKKREDYIYYTAEGTRIVISQARMEQRKP